MPGVGRKTHREEVKTLNFPHPFQCSIFICWIKSPSRNGNKKDFVSIYRSWGWLFFLVNECNSERITKKSWSGRLSWIQCETHWILSDGSSDRLSSSRRFSQYSLNKIFSSIFQLTGTKDFTAAIAARRKLWIVAIATVDLVVLRAELLVNERDATALTEEADFVPVLVFVAQILDGRK